MTVGPEWKNGYFEGMRKIDKCFVGDEVVDRHLFDAQNQGAVGDVLV